VDAPVIVDRIVVYPVKGLDPVEVRIARILPGGSLEHDREFALSDSQGHWINAKREPKIHALRSEFDLSSFRVTLRGREATPETFHLTEQQRELEEWFGAFFGYPASVKRNVATGFPDDTDSPGPTLVSTATLREVDSWFGFSDIAQTGRRFRANILLKTEEPFWEDRLFGEDDQSRPFRIGNVQFLGVNPCQRCVVPSRDPMTGIATPDFQRVFAEKRAARLPEWAPKSRFTHYYRLTVNTRIPSTEAGKAIQVGDELSL
jgi:uncharacterized protein YcbX